MLIALYEAVYNSRASGIASDVERCANHIEDTVKGVE